MQILSLLCVHGCRKAARCNGLQAVEPDKRDKVHICDAIGPQNEA